MAQLPIGGSLWPTPYGDPITSCVEVVGQIASLEGEMNSAILSQAEGIARTAHEGQNEESTGDPYIRHIERVVDLVEGTDAKAVAWLHDVLEDTDIESDDLVKAGIPDNIVNAVMQLSRDPVRPYAEYIQDIKESDSYLAISVKRADLRDHLRPNCPERLRPRYEKGWSVLTDEPPPDSRGPTVGETPAPRATKGVQFTSSSRHQMLSRLPESRR